MSGRPQESEAAPYYFTYIDRVGSGDIVSILDGQTAEVIPLFSSISEEKSLSRYAPDKWTIRQVLGHINDTERMFAFRALWFARGFAEPLASFDQNVAVSHAGSDRISWAAHMEEFRQIRAATVSLFRSLPPEAWTRTGIASGNPFTVQALAYIAAGHLIHHVAVLRERYLKYL